MQNRLSMFRGNLVSMQLAPRSVHTVDADHRRMQRVRGPVVSWTAVDGGCCDNRAGAYTIASMTVRIAIPEPTSTDTEYNQRSLPPYIAA
ncbi:MAG: hypothetical protein WCC73_09085, partial [Terracidiphilus sp.]